MSTRNYHRLFAWLPTRMESGQLVWLASYWIYPARDGRGILLNKTEYILDSYNNKD